MASIGNDPNGRKRILFVSKDGSRKTIRLGETSRHDAESIRGHVETLLATSINGQSIARKTAVWLADIGDVLHARLAGVGLIEPRPATVKVKLGTFLDGYLKQREGELKPGTMLVMRQAKRWLVRFLGEDRDPQTVKNTDADAFKAHMLGKGRARATVNKWCRYARHYFEVAKRRSLVVENPFGHITGAVRGNAARRRFIQGADILKVIDAAPDPQWKLMIALARWGGLRIPSEALALTWRDVNFGKGLFIVRSSKTEHHADDGVRIVPMFPELVEHFQKVFDDAPEGEGSPHVISICRDPAANLRTQLVRYIEAAGLTAWPKPWQNLRSTRATELADQYPSHVCAAWLGHTEAIADEFYRMVTDEHFSRAIKAAHNPAQQAPAEGRTDSQLIETNHTKPLVFQGGAIACELVLDGVVGDEGTEHIAVFPKKSEVCRPSGTQSGTLPADSELLTLIEAWPRLPAATRQQIMDCIRATGK